jgi:hypothetical protein
MTWQCERRERKSGIIFRPFAAPTPIKVVLRRFEGSGDSSLPRILGFSPLFVGQDFG